MGQLMVGFEGQEANAATETVDANVASDGRYHDESDAFVDRSEFETPVPGRPALPGVKDLVHVDASCEGDEPCNSWSIAGSFPRP